METNFESKNYIHFDNKIGFSKKIEEYVKCYEENSKHSFLPLIYDEINFDRFLDITKSGVTDRISRTNSSGQSKLVPIKSKTRPIMYASHLDNYIYKFYGLKLNELYNKFLIKNKFDDTSVAYRTNKDGKCNIDFAAEAINFIKNTGDCYVYIGDFTGFFDSLNHKYLKNMILTLYDGKEIPKHQYTIFKNITNYSYINKKDIIFYTNEVNGKYKRGYQKAFKKMSDFREFKGEISIVGDIPSKVLKRNTDYYGIPQGTAISAIYSNIYMLEGDRIINEIVSKKYGMYRRYSDDYIIILPNITEKEFLEIKLEIEDTLKNDIKLIIHPEKTQVMEYRNGKLIDFETKENYSLDYLGFRFDGKFVRMREKSIYNFYRTSYKLIKKGMKISIQKGHIRENARLTYKRKLYQKYHKFGERTDRKYKYKTRAYGSFITYAYKCQKIFDKTSPSTTNLMKKQISKHELKLEKKIVEANNVLKNIKSNNCKFIRKDTLKVGNHQ